LSRRQTKGCGASAKRPAQAATATGRATAPGATPGEPRARIPVDLDVSSERLPPDLEASAYFIVAEALTNVVKHARATQATVRAAIDGGVLTLEVRDDGVGGANPDGHGLVGMADRVDALGGRLWIESTDGDGTALAARLPLSTRWQRGSEGR
jgi:signal transduction histidine kinase